MDYFVHPLADVEPGARIGRGTKVWRWSHICAGASVGEDCVIGQNVFIAAGVIVGNRCKIQNNVSLYAGVILEEEVFCGPSMVFTNVRNPRAGIPKMDQSESTLVQQGATLGANCTVVCGVVIGKHSFIAAGALVSRDVRDFALAIGVPASRAGWVCKCGERLPQHLVCFSCKERYHRIGSGGIQWAEKSQ